MTFVGSMCFFYLLYTFLLSSLAVSVGVLKEQGLATSPYSDAVNSRASIFFILAVSVGYLGWIGGIIAFGFCMLSLPHATFGWLLSVPASLRFRRIAAGGNSYAVMDALRKHATRTESLFLLATWAYFVFMIVSFFVVPYGSFRSWWTLPHILIFVGICAVGFVLRMLVGPKMQPFPDADNDLTSY